jgi:ATP synthase F1 epsilon subunit
MKLSVYTIKRTVFSGETPRVTVPTVTGEVTILEHHIPYVTILEPGLLRYTHAVQQGAEMVQKEESLAITGGFLEVRDNNEVRILADA